MGHPEIQTPNLDALAERSLVMSRGYVTAPLCRPSLASMVTGLYLFQHESTDFGTPAPSNARFANVRRSDRPNAFRDISN
jgi:arylsulfatase A-like enzyme